jgi:branched-chain amino acid transport system substrate-binding protein
LQPLSLQPLFRAWWRQLRPTPRAPSAEQFIPLLVYRTGQFALLGIPWADGKADYLKLVNTRDGGVNGVKLNFEECETAYDAAKGVECYERLKNRGSGASGFVTPSPLVSPLP